MESLNIDACFERGERILTEISRKFTRPSVEHMLAGAGLVLDAWLESDDRYFALSVARPSS